MEKSTITKFLGWGIVAAALAVLFRRVWLMELDSFKFDDAFMFIRYAENILAGEGYTWNAGDPAVYGCTSILYTYVIAGVFFIFKGLGASKVLVFTALTFGLGFLLILQQGLYREMQSRFLKDRMVVALFTIPFLVFPLIFGFHVSTGMETTLSLMLHGVFLFSVLAYARREAPGLAAVIWPVLVGWMLFLARPDNALVAGLFPVLYLLTQKKMRHLAWFAGAFAVVIAIDSALKYMLLGDVLPLSFYAKQSGFTEGYTAKYFWNPVKYLTQFTAYGMPFILALFAFARKRNATMVISFLLPVLLTFLYYFSFDQVMGFDARLYFPFIVYLIVAAFLITDDALRQNDATVRTLWQPERVLRRISFLLVFLILTTYSKYRFINMYEAWAIRSGLKDAVEIPDLLPRKYNREKSITKINSLLKQFPDDLVFAATEHGFIAADNAGKRIMDLSGLHNETIARKGYSDALLKAEHPDFIWMPHQDLTVLHYEVRSGEYFREHYEYIPHIYAFGCAVRKDSEYYEALKAVIH